MVKSNQIKSSLYSPYYAEACNELRGPFPRLSAWATQLRRNVATVASRWRHCADLTGPGIEPQTSRTDSVRFATELTAGSWYCKNFHSWYCKKKNHGIAKISNSTRHAKISKISLLCSSSACAVAECRAEINMVGKSGSYSCK